MISIKASIEDEDLNERYGHRAELPEKEWLEIPDGMTIGEWFRKDREENKNQKTDIKTDKEDSEK